jgi:hypothetical protein
MREWLRKKLWPHRYIIDLLPQAQLERLRTSILESPYLAESDLNEGFAGSYGFSIFFKISQRTKAEKLIPGLKEFLDTVLYPDTNLIFLNPLQIQKGQGVDAHADKTLVSFLEKPEAEVPFPFRVSVLYLKIPGDANGGDLVFHRWMGQLKISPQDNLLVEFPGWMLHQVTPFQCNEGDYRLSLVMEQYVLNAQELEAVPDWVMDTTRSFDQFLQDAASSEETNQQEDDDLGGEDPSTPPAQEHSASPTEERSLPS